MEGKTPALYFVIQRFPRYHCLIQEFYHESDSFQSLCEDYLKCHETLERLQAERQTRKVLIEEYKSLNQELENEIVQYFERT